MYKLSENNILIRVLDNVQFPMADGNKDYEQYKVWLAEGNEPEPADGQEDDAGIL